MTHTDDHGSAAVEFLAFGIPGVLLTLLAFQFIWAGYLSNVAFDAASEAAGVAALYDGTESAGEARGNLVMKQIARAAMASVEVSTTTLAGQAAKRATVQVYSPLIAFGSIPIVQSAVAVQEQASTNE